MNENPFKNPEKSSVSKVEEKVVPTIETQEGAPKTPDQLLEDKNILAENQSAESMAVSSQTDQKILEINDPNSKEIAEQASAKINEERQEINTSWKNFAEESSSRKISAAEDTTDSPEALDELPAKIAESDKEKTDTQAKMEPQPEKQSEEEIWAKLDATLDANRSAPEKPQEKLKDLDQILEENINPNKLKEDSSIEKSNGREGVKTLERATLEFQRVKDGLKEYQDQSSQFISNLREDLPYLYKEIETANPRELGYRQAGQLAERTIGLLRQRMSSIEENIPHLISSSQIEEMENLLKSAADGKLTESKISETKSMFQKIVQTAEDKMGEIAIRENEILKIAEENYRLSRVELKRAEEILKRNMQGSIIDTYSDKSRKLAEALNDRIASQGKQRQKIIENIRDYATRIYALRS